MGNGKRDSVFIEDLAPGVWGGVGEGEGDVCGGLARGRDDVV